MIRYILFFALVWASVFSSICYAQRLTWKDWAKLGRIALKSLLTTAVAAVIVAALVIAF